MVEQSGEVPFSGSCAGQVRTEEEFQRLASRCWNQSSNLGRLCLCQGGGRFVPVLHGLTACERLIFEAIRARMLTDGAEGASSTAIVRTDKNTQ